MNFNRTLFELLFQWSGRDPLLDAFFVFFARFLPYLLVLGFIVWCLAHKEWRLRWLILAEGAMATILARGIITEIIRFFYHSPRPFDALSLTPLVGESGYTFPSGHAAFFFAMAMTVFFYNRRLGWWYFAFATIVGLARIFAGVHWPLDILGGAAVGILSGFLIHRLVKPHLERIHQPRLFE
ncbi:MAG: phosphatase PAP2 family protein [Patescibacteria group bacterium]